MISNSVMIAMVVTIAVCFVTPAIVLAWLMIKKRARRMVIMFVFGAMARIAAIIIQLPVITMLNSLDGYTDMAKYIQIIISNIIYAGTVVLAITVLLQVIRKNGLNYNRAWTIFVGAAAVDMIVGTGISYFAKMTLATSINDGSIYNTYDNAEELVKGVNSITVSFCMADAVSAIATIFVSAAATLLILYGISNKKLEKTLSVVFAMEYINLVGGGIISTYTNPVFAMIFEFIMIVINLYVIIRISKKVDKLVIKPASMMQQV